MAAVAPAQYETRTVNLEYSPIRCDAEATGEQKLKAGIILEKPVKIKNRAATEITQTGLLSGGERKDDSLSSGESGAGAANLSNGKPQSDDVTAEEEFLHHVEKSLAGKKDGSDKSFGEADSGVAEDWESRNEAVGKAEVEVANRNNCMLVFSHQKKKIFAYLNEEAYGNTVSVFKTRSTTQAKNMKNIWHVRCAEITVSCRAFKLSNQRLASWISRVLECQLTDLQPIGSVPATPNLLARTKVTLTQI